MTYPLRPETTPGYVAARLDDTTLLIDLLAVPNIMNDTDTVQNNGRKVLQRNGRDLEPVPLAGSMQSFANGRRTQIMVIADKTGEFALSCDDIRVLPAAKLNVQPLRRCMGGPESLFVGMAMIDETIAFLCNAEDLGTITRRLWEQEHGKLTSNPD